MSRILDRLGMAVVMGLAVAALVILVAPSIIEIGRAHV